MDVASAIAASTTPRACHIASAASPTLDIADSAIRSANCAPHCATDSPIGNTMCYGSGKTERECDDARDFAYAEFGALAVTVDEPPSNGPRRVDPVRSSNFPDPRLYCTL